MKSNRETFLEQREHELHKEKAEDIRRRDEAMAYLQSFKAYPTKKEVINKNGGIRIQESG